MKKIWEEKKKDKISQIEKVSGNGNYRRRKEECGSVRYCEVG